MSFDCVFGAPYSAARAAARLDDTKPAMLREAASIIAPPGRQGRRERLRYSNFARQDADLHDNDPGLRA